MVTGNGSQAILNDPQQFRQVNRAVGVVGERQQGINHRQVILPELAVRPLPDPGQREQITPSAVQQAQHRPGNLAPAQFLVQHVGHGLLGFRYLLSAFRCGRHTLHIPAIDKILAIDQGVQLLDRMLKYSGILLKIRGDPLHQLINPTLDHRIDPATLDTQLSQAVHHPTNRAVLVIKKRRVPHDHFQNGHFQLPHALLGIFTEFGAFHHRLEKAVDHINRFLLLFIQPVVTASLDLLDHPVF